MKPLINLIMYVCFRPEVIGRENIPKSGRVVLAGTHTKWLDSPLLIAVNKRQVHFMAKCELFKGPLKVFMNGMGCIPVDRKRKDRDSLIRAKEVLKKTTGCDIINLPDVIRLKDMLLTQSAVLSAMQCAASSGGSRGGAVVSEKELTEYEILKLRSGDSSSHDGKIFVTVFENDSFSTGTRDVKAIPQPDLWFENVWNSYNKKWGIN